ncbi:hypothetical protein DK058_26035 [Salmonella enterica subsp. enterica serovar Typhi]|nr:hypothetical protein [Salmonella enterica subsp. enterica serovar Typhi]EFG9152814.1 hypothetical protein [Escherichia coli]MIL09881.1 hypothetical protein [Salmonella enterica subsp. enterica serovar Enteritidis]
MTAKPPVGDGSDPLELIQQTDKQKRAQRSRNVAIGVALAAFVVFVYFVSIFKLGASIFTRTF